jgi:hypothetical protein
VGGVILFRQTGCPFICGRGLERRWPEGGGPTLATSTPGAAALGACWRGEVLASGYCRHALACSRGSVSCREAEGKERGSGLFLHFLPSLLDGVRAGGLWSRQRGTLRVRRRARAYEIGVINSGFDFTEICPPSVRSNARMKLNFENLKSATVGCQDTS